jgi:hypothetical protein
MGYPKSAFISEIIDDEYHDEVEGDARYFSHNNLNSLIFNNTNCCFR